MIRSRQHQREIALLILAYYLSEDKWSERLPTFLRSHVKNLTDNTDEQYEVRPSELFDLATALMGKELEFKNFSPRQGLLAKSWLKQRILDENITISDLGNVVRSLHRECNYYARQHKVLVADRTPLHIPVSDVLKQLIMELIHEQLSY